ncbi:hypothetical protein [Paraburkholderia terrae]|uniref:hypothetical protein n=1 Tax=Paraburkholderia terrae TaxID=311230 RepID=UPI000A8CD1BE|nr:hypothetical protein [Paraburkholderia terrae]
MSARAKWYLPLRPACELTPPDKLSGRNGKFRAPESHLAITADTDWAAAEAYLESISHYGMPTRHRYARALDQFFLWSWIVKEKAVSSLMYQDLREYVAFCKNPHPRDFWTTTKLGGRRRATDGWKPFGSAKLDARYDWAQGIAPMFTFWVSNGYVTGNPIGDAFTGGWLTRLTGPARKPRLDHVFDFDVWPVIMKGVNNLPRNTPRAEDSAERARFLFTFADQLAPTQQELVQGRMSNFRLQGDSWFWCPPLTNNKLQTPPIPVPVPYQTLEALSRYRVRFEMSPLPDPNDDSPLILSVNHETEGHQKGKFREPRLHNVVSIVTQMAARYLPDDRKDKAETLRSMTYPAIRLLILRNRKN